MAGKRDLSKCAARGGMTKGEVHAAVHTRDGGRCVRCGMTNEQHTRTFGRGIQVHRKEPGSLYTVSGCVLLCCHCHKGEPKRAKGTPDAEQATKTCMVRIPPNYYAALANLVKVSRRPLTREITIALDAHFAANGIMALEEVATGAPE